MKKIIKVMALVLSLVMLASLMVACASTSATTASTSQSAPASTSESTVKTDRGSLVVYTNSGSNGRDQWLTEKAKENGFEIQVVQIAGGDLTNRIIAEKNTQLADVVFGLNAMEFTKIKKEDILLPYTPSWSNKVDVTLGDKDGNYFPIVVQPLVLAFNTDFINPENAPKDWPALATTPEFKGKYTILGLGGGTQKTIIASILIRYLDANGTAGVSQEGWDIMKTYIQNGVVPVEGEDWFGKFLDGSRPMTSLWGSGVLQYVKEKNLTNVDYMVPEMGVPYVVEQTAIFKNSKNVETAKEFVEWFGSAEVQSAWSTQFSTIPCNTDALAKSGADVQAMMSKVHPQAMDWEVVGTNIDQWMEKIQLEFVQ